MLKSAAARDAAACRRARACGRIPRSAQRRHGLARIEQAVRHRTRASRAWKARSSSGAELHAHLVDLLDADAVLAGDGAADLDAQLQDFGGELLGALQLVRRCWRRTGSADAGCRRPRGTRSRSAGRTSSPSRAMQLQHLAQALARDGAVHAVVVGRDAARRRETRPCARTRSAGARLRRATRAMRVAPRASQHRFHARDLVLDFLARAVGFAQQDRRGVEVVAGVDELLDGARRRACPSSRGPPG